eukprot:CAMPEP_0119049670 /NCGR_PEP_ID=MMETSP1177-20130426/65805_1 /TAXON_ID=2985 /ORGANISM="Ochromonas sp, Strain CCMP1899" /LENGTH=267 /DNA_ID=CAMNT_0007027181 /DNA_START=221 /DNA_END=1025 /DNA_ORIENTATION=+
MKLEAVHAQLAIFMALKGSFDIIPSQECTSLFDDHFESIMKNIEHESNKTKNANFLEDAGFALPIRDVRAASAFQSSINLYDRSPNAWLGLGLTTLHKLDDYKAAQKSLPLLQKALSLSIETTGNTSINTGTIHYHLSSALLLCGRYKETIEHTNKVINCISANGLDKGEFKMHSIVDCANTHILNGEDKDALRMIILQLEIGSSQGIEGFYKATKTASLLMEEDRENIKLSTWKYVASLVKKGFWEFDAEFDDRSTSSPTSMERKN